MGGLSELKAMRRRQAEFFAEDFNGQKAEGDYDGSSPPRSGESSPDPPLESQDDDDEKVWDLVYRIRGLTALGLYTNCAVGIHDGYDASQPEHRFASGGIR